MAGKAEDREHQRFSLCFVAKRPEDYRDPI